MSNMKHTHGKTFKEGQKLINYVETRDRMINEIINMTQIAYRKDKSMLSAVIDLTTTLKMVSPQDGTVFVKDMWGFMMWTNQTKNYDRSVLTTIIHDLGEFSRNRFEKWFCPRTAGYRKYLSGVSGISIA